MSKLTLDKTSIFLCEGWTSRVSLCKARLWSLLARWSCHATKLLSLPPSGPRIAARQLSSTKGLLPRPKAAARLIQLMHHDDLVHSMNQLVEKIQHANVLVRA
eukprot:2792383-Amphidinium_carterae.1